MHYIVNHDTAYCFTLARLSTVFPFGATFLVPFVVVIVIVLIVLIIIVLLRFVDSLFTILLIVVVFFSFNPPVMICVFV